jgi:hypothetical protein
LFVSEYGGPLIEISTSAGNVPLLNNNTDIGALRVFTICGGKVKLEGLTKTSDPHLVH